MYRFYLKQGEKQFLFPVTPSEIHIKTPSGNQTVSILNMGEINILRRPKLREIRFKALLPGRKLHFVQTEGGFHEPLYFIHTLAEFQYNKKPVQFLIFRRLSDGTQIFCENAEMVLEDVSVMERGGDQGDFWVEIFLREYRAAKSVIYHAAKDGNKTILSAGGQQREEREVPKTYTVKKGDNLWNIARSMYGTGGKYKEIAQKNGIKNPNLLFVGQVLQL